MHEVETPPLVWCQGRRGPFSATRQPLFAPAPLPHLEPLGLIDPMHPFVIVGETIPPQQHEQTPVAPAAPRMGVAAQRFAQRLLRSLTIRMIMITADGQTHQPTGPCLAQGISSLSVVHGGASCLGPHQFFAFTSLSTRMSSACSATIFFSSLFSRSSSRSRCS